MIHRRSRRGGRSHPLLLFPVFDLRMPERWKIGRAEFHRGEVGADLLTHAGARGGRGEDSLEWSARILESAREWTIAVVSGHDDQHRPREALRQPHMREAGFATAPTSRIVMSRGTRGQLPTPHLGWSGGRRRNKTLCSNGRAGRAPKMYDKRTL